jgi:hypothetical protein
MLLLCLLVAKFGELSQSDENILVMAEAHPETLKELLGSRLLTAGSVSKYASHENDSKQSLA